MWDRTGKLVTKVHSAPLEDRVPMEGFHGAAPVAWRPTDGATLLWWEALDEGNPKKKVAFRDKLMLARAPFTAPPVEVYKTQQRAMGLIYGESGGLALVSDYDRERRGWKSTESTWTTPAPRPTRCGAAVCRTVKTTGSPLMKRLPTGGSVMQQSGDYVFLSAGSHAQGRQTLPRSAELEDRQERLFQAGDIGYESVGLLRRRLQVPDFLRNTRLAAKPLCPHQRQR